MIYTRPFVHWDCRLYSQSNATLPSIRCSERTIVNIYCSKRWTVNDKTRNTVKFQQLHIYRSQFSGPTAGSTQENVSAWHDPICVLVQSVVVITETRIRGTRRAVVGQGRSSDLVSNKDCTRRSYAARHMRHLKCGVSSAIDNASILTLWKAKNYITCDGWASTSVITNLIHLEYLSKSVWITTAHWPVRTYIDEK